MSAEALEAKSIPTGTRTVRDYQVSFEETPNVEDGVTAVVNYPQQQERMFLGRRLNVMNHIGSERWYGVRYVAGVAGVAILASTIDGTQKLSNSISQTSNSIEGLKGVAELMVSAMATGWLWSYLSQRERVFTAIQHAWRDRLRRTPLE